MTNEEKLRENERESMFIVNEWAAKYFQDILQNDVDGRAIGMQYFRSRGFRDDIIRKFQLGFASNQRTALFDEAVKKGYQPKYLVDTGLCFKVDKEEAGNKSGQDKYLDRFSGRAIFPWLSVSGKVGGFRRTCAGYPYQGCEPEIRELARQYHLPQGAGTLRAVSGQRRPSPRKTACIWWRDIRM